MRIKHKNFRIVFVAYVVVVTSVLSLTSGSAGAITYSPYCTSAACRAAADREAEAQAQADEKSAAASDLQGQVELLNSEIAALEAEIAANEAIADDLANQITANEEKLQSQQSALVSLLVELHFKGKINTIMTLAGSDSLSDFTEKQSRQETAKSQITTSAQAVEQLKNELSQQKASVDAIIASQSSKRSEIANKRAEQNNLIAKYQHDANAYAADAEAARKIKAEEINKAIRESINSSGSGRTAVSGANAAGNSYPYREECPDANLEFMAYGGYVCQCTSYAGWKVQEAYGISVSSWPRPNGSGNANQWGVNARAAGYRVDDVPAPGTVAYSTGGAYGHVMWVESVEGNTITLSEYNYVYGDFSRRTNVPASAYNYIHFN